MKTFLTIVIVILLLRILVRYQTLKAQDMVREQERMRYKRMQQQQRTQHEPKITITRQPKKDDGDYIDYEEVK